MWPRFDPLLSASKAVAAPLDTNHMFRDRSLITPQVGNTDLEPIEAMTMLGALPDVRDVRMHSAQDFEDGLLV